jgi:hypothetical protein
MVMHVTEVHEVRLKQKEIMEKQIILKPLLYSEVILKDASPNLKFIFLKLSKKQLVNISSPFDDLWKKNYNRFVKPGSDCTNNNTKCIISKHWFSMSIFFCNIHLIS